MPTLVETRPETQTVKILLVDDEPRNLTALEAVLASDDRTLVRAESGEEALRWLLREDFALIILDVHMPAMDGFETAALIRARERTQNVPIIFLTAANKERVHVSTGYSLGAVDYIFKPFDPEVLRSKVAVFVELFKKTEEVQQQAAQLAETTAFLKNVLESSTEYGIIAQDLQGKILTWNEGARRIYGFTAEEMVGKANVRSLLSEDVQISELDPIWATALRTGTGEGEFTHRRKNGQSFPARMVVTVRRDSAGKPVGFLCITRDITQQKIEEQRAQLLIREQVARAEAESARARFAFLAEASSLLVSSLDCEQTLQSVARLTVSTLAHSCAIDLLEEDGRVRRVAEARAAEPESLGGLDNGQACSPMQPVDLAVLPTELAAVLRLGQAVLVQEPSGHAAAPHAGGLSDPGDGSSASLIVPLEAHGQTLGALSLSGPRSRRSFDESDRALVQDLARRIALAVVNARLYREAQNAVRVRDDFLTSVSHDLKTPLTAIKGHAQLLRRRVSRLDTPEAQRIVEGLAVIDSTTAKMTAMINEMLDVTRLRLGQPLELYLQATDLIALVRDTVSALVQAKDTHSIRLECAVEQLVGRWDGVRLERVLGNLLSNAMKYSPVGSEITLALRRDEDHAGAWAVIEVRDHGIGIPADELPLVFERFYRARNVLGRIAGTGVGLAGVLQIVEQHGGTVALESEEGKGTTVTVRLPLAGPPAPAED